MWCHIWLFIIWLSILDTAEVNPLHWNHILSWVVIKTKTTFSIHQANDGIFMFGEMVRRAWKYEQVLTGLHLANFFINIFDYYYVYVLYCVIGHSVTISYRKIWLNESHFVHKYLLAEWHTDSCASDDICTDSWWFAPCCSMYNVYYRICCGISHIIRILFCWYLVFGDKSIDMTNVKE